MPIEFGVSRHASKIDKIDTTGDYKVHEQPIDTSKALEEVQRSVEILISELEKSPEGVIVALQSSMVERAAETKDLFAEELRRALEDTDTNTCIELPESSDAVEAFFKKIESQPKTKFVITNMDATSLLGFEKKDSFVPAVNKWKKIFNGDETRMAKLWACHTSEIPALHQELQAKNIQVSENLNPAEFIMTPEGRAARQVRWLKFMETIGKKYFPKRPLRVEAFSHNVAADFATLALLDEDISYASINELLGGNLRQPLERSSVKFSDNSVTVQYRDLVKEYSFQEFDAVMKKIDEKAKLRQEEWKEFNK